MANAVFNSVESYFAKDKLKPNVPYSKFDLSHIRSMDIDFGILYPFWIEDCLPGDRFKISNVLKLQALPLKNPLFNNIKLYTYYFYVPYYLLWRHFDRYISGGRDGTYSADLPVIPFNRSNHSMPGVDSFSVETNIYRSNTLWDYLGFEPYNGDVGGVFHEYFVSAFPFAAYQRIFRDYFFNQDVQTSSNVNEWFPEDDLDFVLHDGVNARLGESSGPSESSGSYYVCPSTSATAADINNRPWLLLLRSRNFNKDYFTSSMFSPQRGPAQALGSNASKISPLIFPDGVVPSSGDYLRLLSVNGTSWQFGFTDNSSPSVSYGRDKLISSLSQLVSTGNFTISDLHLAQQIELWMERNMQVKALYNQFLRIHFSDAPLDERLTKPFYIGGSVQDVQISNVMQTSQTTESSSQGTLTGNASSFDSDYIGTFHSHEYGLIMGICCIMPESYYCHGTDRHWTKQSRFDFYFPEFCDLEPQAILRKEYFSLSKSLGGSPSWLDEPMSYIGRYDEYRHHRSLAVGSLRNNRNLDFSSWVMVRPYSVDSSKPALVPSLIGTHSRNGSFVSPSYHYFDSTKYYDSLISHDVWASGNTVNPFMLQIGISCTAVRPLPYVPDPSRNSY